MRLVTYSHGDETRRIGAVKDGDVVDLSGVAPDMLALFSGDEEAMDRARTAVDGDPAASLADVKLHAPIVPRKFFHTAGNFREHHEESQAVGFSHPVNQWIIFFQNVDAIRGPDDPIVYPPHLTSELDYELELAVVLRKPGVHFDADEAEEYVGGYVIFNDITARDIQRKEMESGIFSFCKAIDSFCPLGPCIVTPDELTAAGLDVHELEMRLRVNGEERQHSNMRNISFTIPEILAHYSPLGYSAGDVLSTGTVSGVAGFQSDPQAWYLKPGDVVEAEIEGIGVLRNPVVAWEEFHGSPPPVAAVAGESR
jgi:2-keto-4-pentenoate hydratase/2-oxohepta-3-ene-1,7-dioic acid hydratase in catechol pathway